MKNFWPHQIFGVSEVRRLMAAGRKRICLCSPTGGGKSKMMIQIAEDAMAEGKRVLQLASRRWLLDQLYTGLTCDGFDVRQMRSGVPDVGQRAYTLASIPTLTARNLMPAADVILVDEAHMNKADKAAELLNEYVDQGATIIGVTATPLELSHLYEDLILAGSRSELRKCGALVPALVYSCGEMDTTDIKRTATGEYTVNDIRKKIWTQAIYARVIEEHIKLNPELRPAILFAPGVEESVWFVDEYTKRGIRAAHIDGDDVYCDGIRTSSSQERRDEILAQLKTGEISVVCNRFVMREGLDIPQLFHLILATPIGSILSHTQIVGRVLRNHPSLPTRDFGNGQQRPYCIVQDHGGCLDDQTEVLTPNGWVGVDEIKNQKSVFAFDRETGAILEEPILNTHDRLIESHEEMYAATGRQADIRVTGNHRIVFKKRTSDKHNKAIWPSAFKLERADSITTKPVRFKIPVSGIQQFSGVNLTDAELELIGWWITDGTKAGKRQSVSISQASHQPHFQDLVSCLNATGIQYRTTVAIQGNRLSQKPSVKFHIPKGTGLGSKKRSGWIHLEKYLDKDLSRDLEEMTVHQFECFLKGVHGGDGDKSKGRNGSYRICTGNKTFADRLQSFCVRRGYQCSVATEKPQGISINPKYSVNIRKNSELFIQSCGQSDPGQVRLSKTDRKDVERVWCVANRLETLITRRNGKVAIIGNSWWRHPSPNADMEDIWRQYYRCGSAKEVTDERMDALRNNQENPADPLTKEVGYECPNCHAVQDFPRHGNCYACGHDMKGKRRRTVIQRSGELKEVTGLPVKRAKQANLPDVAAAFERAYWMAKRKGYSFRKAAAMIYTGHLRGFEHLKGCQIPKNLPFMPANRADMSRIVQNVPMSDLIRKNEGVAK